MPPHAVGICTAEVSKPAATVNTGIAVEDLQPPPGLRHTDTIGIAGDRRHVADDKYRPVTLPSPSHVGKDTSLRVMKVNPFEALWSAIIPVQCPL